MPDGHDSADFLERLVLERLAVDLPDLDQDVFAAIFNLVRAANRVVGELESAVHRPAGWSWAGFRTMFVIWVSGPLEPREIARRAGITRASVSSVLNTLEAEGLVERTRDQADRRLVTARLTANGRTRLRRAVARQHKAEKERLLAGFDAQELQALNGLLRRIARDRH